MNFSSLMTLQRYARIDLGVRIDLPWTPIRDRTRALMDAQCRQGGAGAAAEPTTCRDHVHVAIGTIDYGGGEQGYLVYIKSSLTGDENDYIRDYARRNDRFPHETTGDQFFSRGAVRGLSRAGLPHGARFPVRGQSGRGRVRRRSAYGPIH